MKKSRKPVYINPTNFQRARAALDQAVRIVRLAKNEKELKKTLHLFGIAQKAFDAAFKAHWKD